jgi:tRNA threonylcarbamoyladenosine biosynthesis protein TsaE
MIVTGRFRTVSPEETEALGRRVGESIDGRAVLLLAGDLGAGKTLFARGLAAGLGIDPDEVSSPTFSLVNRYEGGRLPLYHLDLYRLEGPDVAFHVGLDELLEEQAVVAVEWPERLGDDRPPEAYVVDLAEAGDEVREIEIRGQGSGARAEDSPLTPAP